MKAECLIKMNKIHIKGVIFLISFLCVIFSSCSSVKNKNWSESCIINEKYSDFCTEIDNYLLENKFEGVVLVGKGKNIIFAKGYGVCDKNDKNSSPININSTFEIGSISKQITAAAIMQLVQKKKISLNDKLSKYFPEYKYGDDITIKMLLNMRSGLTDHINDAEDFFPPEIYSIIRKKQIVNDAFEEDFVLNYFYDAPLLATPDSTYFYCNTNYYLLAQIVQKVSGKKYHQYIKDNIFDKCGMFNTNTDFQNTDTKGYDFKNRYYSIPYDFAKGCGDINSCATDLFKWNVQFADGKIVNKKSLKQMLDTESYGFGVYVKENKIFHTGITNVFNSYDSYSFDTGISIIVLVNKPVAQCNATFIANKIEKISSERICNPRKLKFSPV